ncbi:SMI1/KNR4 family protein [Streptomyces litchfieldiae]|uniref:Knr4/Smi1-like domain-containing protein n=1 Tax=Streptomyces litchfieldiae TaxID=3075543 RepID=A0ABU2MLH9_9ACTN|nr:SMI1/KNR4 family protein [Streptomyces sp. DSM 44938]MDT0342467.1 hypothetical protein [Streptomyces sp. DSM 44938]
MTELGQYVAEFVEAWNELDGLYRDLAAAAWWPREIREWEGKRREHEWARKDVAPSQEGFEAAARRWRAEAAGLSGQLARLRRSTPEQQAQWLDPWSKVRRSGTGHADGPPLWPGWRERLWRAALASDLWLPRPLLAAELAAAEEQLGVRLPGEYRRFLLEVAAGIPGGMPAPGLAPLVRDDAGRWGWDDIGTRTRLSRLAEEFPAREVDALPDDEPRRADFPSEEAYLAELVKWDNDEPPYGGDPVGDLTCGALCLHSLGCGDAVWLVVSGPLAGRMWSDHLVNEGGLYALRRDRRAPVFFREWFLDARG